ncbi:MAG: virulence RhuM family protein [Clostridia bacterium]|nr:virulence RhuM family protein [Clostridia bacterium]
MNNIENLKDLIIYQSQNNENISVEVLYDEEDFWLTQKSMAKLFNVAENNITYHLQNIFNSGELNKDSVTQKIRVTASDGKNYNTNFYSIDAIIAVGYRVNSKEATDFRIWATKTLKEYIKKGFVLNDEMLKNGPKFGKDYFKELLERIRSIRTSERRIWQQITDIFAECSIDYDKNSEITHQFYAMIQNKFHYAITGNTAAEIIYQKADHTKENMGLTTWKNSPDGRILKSDVIVAKNYLEEKQIKRLERAVTGYFDYIEDLVERENIFTMEEFSKSVNEFLEFRKYDILKDNGKISRKMAEEKAEKEYNEFNKTQKIISDFDKLLIEAKKLKNN